MFLESKLGILTLPSEVFPCLFLTIFQAVFSIIPTGLVVKISFVQSFCCFFFFIWILNDRPSFSFPCGETPV